MNSVPVSHNLSLYDQGLFYNSILAKCKRCSHLRYEHNDCKECTGAGYDEKTYKVKCACKVFRVRPIKALSPDDIRAYSA